MVNIPKEYSKKHEQFKKEHKAEIRANLYYGLGIGAGFTTLVTIVSLYVSNKTLFNIIMGFLCCLIVSMIGFIYFEWNRVYGKRCIEGEFLSEAVENAIERFQSINPYSNILNNQLKLTWGLMGIFSKIVDETAKKGGVVISAKSDDYMKYLEESLANARISYKAILCGYDEISKEYIYRPKWFFVKEDDIKGDIIKDENGNLKMDDDKSDWLKKVMDANYLKRDRLLVFPEKILAEDFKDKEMRNQFLNMNEGLNLYLVDIDEVKKLIDVNIGKYIMEDYAIIDNSFVLKHDTDSLLLFASIVSIDPYCKIFEILENDLKSNKNKRFKKIDKAGIKESTKYTAWEDWVKRILSENTSR